MKTTGAVIVGIFLLAISTGFFLETLSPAAYIKEITPTMHKQKFLCSNGLYITFEAADGIPSIVIYRDNKYLAASCTPTNR